MGFWVVFQKDCPKEKKKTSLDVVSCCSSVTIVVGSQKSAGLLVTVLGCAVAPSSALAAALTLWSAVSSLQWKTNSCWGFFSLFFSWSDHALACLVLLHCLLNNSDISV